MTDEDRKPGPLQLLRLSLWKMWVSRWMHGLC